MPRTGLTTKGMGGWTHLSQVCEHLKGDFRFPGCSDKCKYREENLAQGRETYTGMSWKNYVERKHSTWVWKNEYTFTKQKRKVVTGRRDSLCQVSKTLRTRKSETKSRCPIDIIQKTGEGEKGVPVDPPHEGFMARIIYPPLYINERWTEGLNTWPRVTEWQSHWAPQRYSPGLWCSSNCKCTGTTPPRELLSDPIPKQVLISWLPMDQGEGPRKPPQNQHWGLFPKRRSLHSIVRGMWAPWKHNSGETEANVHIRSIQFPRINYG